MVTETWSVSITKFQWSDFCYIKWIQNVVPCNVAKEMSDNLKQKLSKSHKRFSKKFTQKLLLSMFSGVLILIRWNRLKSLEIMRHQYLKMGIDQANQKQILLITIVQHCLQTYSCSSTSVKQCPQCCSVSPLMYHDKSEHCNFCISCTLLCCSCCPKDVQYLLSLFPLLCAPFFCGSVYSRKNDYVVYTTYI